MKGKAKESSNAVGMVNNGLIERVVKKFIRELLTECIDDVTNDYLKYTKALFVINAVLMPRIVKWLARRTLIEIVADVIYDTMLKEVILTQMDFLSQAELEKKQDELENEEKEKAFGEYIDSLIMEACLLRISREYEAEESQLFKAEAISKQKRDALAEKRRELKENLDTDSKYNYDQGKDIKTKSMNDFNPYTGSISNSKLKKQVTVPIDTKSINSNSQVDQKDSIKDIITEVNKSGINKEPKTQLEDALMNLHS